MPPGLTFTSPPAVEVACSRDGEGDAVAAAAAMELAPCWLTPPAARAAAHGKRPAGDCAAGGAERLLCGGLHLPPARVCAAGVALPATKAPQSGEHAPWASAAVSAAAAAAPFWAQTAAAAGGKAAVAGAGSSLRRLLEALVGRLPAKKKSLIEITNSGQCRKCSRGSGRHHSWWLPSGAVGPSAAAACRVPSSWSSGRLFRQRCCPSGAAVASAASCASASAPAAAVREALPHWPTSAAAAASAITACARGAPSRNPPMPRLASGLPAPWLWPCRGGGSTSHELQGRVHSGWDCKALPDNSPIDACSAPLARTFRAQP